MMTLRELLHGVTATPVARVPVSGIMRHSKQVRPGDCFVAVRGATEDGHQFIEEAIGRGASAIVAERLPSGMSRSCPCVVVSNSKAALAAMAARFYGNPSTKLRLIGVTGTNGKTTTTYLMRSIVEAAGSHAGLLGTIVYQMGTREVPSTNTTPGPLELQRYFAQMVGEGLEWCTLEASSHALVQGRLDGLQMEAGIFLNLGSDHLDYHKTRQAYAAAKRRLFDYVRPDGVAIVNVDDEFGRTLAETIPCRRVVTMAAGRPAKVAVKQIVCSWQGISLLLDSPWGVVPVTSPLIGRHNVSNVAAAATTMLALGIRPAAIREGLAGLAGVPGRLERVPNDLGVNILIDYAHTADALRLVLLALRELTRGRLIVLFGCGGNRDRSKRPAMGKIASLLADHIVLTSDNPRDERPLEILDEIKAGFPPDFESVQMVPDREQAIGAALAAARPNDTVILAGKGHEAYQIFNNVSIPFLDRDVVQRWLGSRQSVALS